MWGGGFHKPISRPSSYALRKTFMPQKASLRFGAEQIMTLRGAKHVFEINPEPQTKSLDRASPSRYSLPWF